MEKDEIYMRLALKEAEMALEENEIPIGAVIIYKDRVIGKSHNQVEKLKDPTAHAEILAITQASNYLKSKWLLNCVLYVTVEPCCMCAGAIVLSRIKNIVFGATDPKSGCIISKMNINDLKLNHKINFRFGILRKECKDILKKFFRH